MNNPPNEEASSERTGRALLRDGEGEEQGSFRGQAAFSPEWQPKGNHNRKHHDDAPMGTSGEVMDPAHPLISQAEG